MNRSLIPFVLAAALAAGLARAQPPEAPVEDVAVDPLTGAVCLTNACSEKAKVVVSGSARIASVPQAIREGNVAAVRELGGTVEQGLEAMRIRNQARADAAPTPEDRESRLIVAGNFQMFADQSTGATHAWDDDTNMVAPDNRIVVGSILRQEPGGGGRRIWLTSDGGVVGIVQPFQIAPPIGTNPLPPGFRPTPVP